MKKTNQWKQTIAFLKSARLPWVHFILAAIVPFLTTYIYVYLPELEGQIAAGEIFDPALIRKYLFFSVLMLLLNVATFYSAWVEIQFDRHVQKLTWRNLLLMPMRTFEKAQPSTLISRITDDATYVSSLVNYILSVILSIYSTVLMILSLFQLSARLATFTIPILLINFVFVLIARSKGYDVGYSLQEAISRYTSFLSERVSQLPLVKSMGTEDDEFARGCALSESRRKEEMRAMLYEIVIAISMELTNILLVAIILIGGAALVKGGSLDIDQLIAFYILSMSLPNTLQELLFQFLKLQQFHGSVEVIADLATQEEDRAGGDASINTLTDGIVFDHVNFCYASKEDAALKDVTFTIPKGKTTAIVGPTGSGKTTILKLLERFYDLSDGDILYDGRSIREFDVSSWRQHFGYIVQNSPLLSGTIRSNILYGAERDMSDTELHEIARQVCLDELIAVSPDGLDARIEGNGTNISGGQRQRIAIARAIAADPEILIMDEATSNLDVKNARAVNHALKKLMRGRTVIVVAHQMNTIRDADQIIVLDNGRVQAIGDHASLMESDTHYRTYCELQDAHS